MNIAVTLLLAFTLYGCTTTTPQQDQYVDSGLRVATVAYISRGETAAVQTVRAKQIIEVTAAVSQYIDGLGAAFTVADVAPYLNRYLMSSSIKPNDRVLIQAVIVEAVSLTQAQGLAVPAEQKASLLAHLSAIQVAAGYFMVQEVGP